MQLPEPLAETIGLIPKNGTITAHEIHQQIDGVSPNAQNNRLERLRALGFVKRARFGKFWRYSRA